MKHHGLNEKSGMFQNMGENQIKEIIHAAACSVFFIDESQRVTLSDIGSVAEIEKWADLEESEVIKMQLVSQFRCNGSDGYLAWLDQALETVKQQIMILTELIMIFVSVIRLQKWRQL